MLTFRQKGKADMVAEKKSATWKVMIAHYLKTSSPLSNALSTLNITNFVLTPSVC
jgi:hypothetical protein